MGNGFRKFTRKLRVGAVIRALLAGLSAGTFTVATLWLVAKLTAREPDIVGYVFLALAPFLLVTLILCACLIPTNRRVARRVDAHLALGEKVQTMVAYRRDPGEMAALQRADTERILSETPRRRVKGVATWVFVMLPLLAALAMAGTLFVPAKEPPAPPPVVDNTFSLTPWQEQALRDLIDDVKVSDMEEDPKERTVKLLEGLLVELKSIKKESTMKEAVVRCVENIHATVADHNTYDLVAQALRDTEHELTRRLGEALASGKELIVGDRLQDLAAALIADGADLTAVAAPIALVLPQAVSASGVDASNELCVALRDMAAALSTLTADLPRDDIEAVMSQQEAALLAALLIQTTNEKVEETTIYTLLSIFGMKVADLPPDILLRPDDPDVEGDLNPDDDEQKNNHGGLGTGEMIFGSNDMIYDPETGTYVTYGEVLGDYYAKITEQLVDGKLSDELEQLLTDYFAKLFNGSDKKEDPAA